MSDIVIPNMEMPTDKQYSLTIFPDGRVIQHWEGVVFGETKAIELEPHGDLISKQETVKNLMNTMCKGCKHTDDCGWCAMAEYRRIVEDAPTVLEASEE